MVPCFLPLNAHKYSIKIQIFKKKTSKNQPTIPLEGFVTMAAAGEQWSFWGWCTSI